MKIKKIISLSIATFILVLSIFGLCSCGDNTSNSPKIENTRPTFSQISNFKLDNLKKYEIVLINFISLMIMMKYGLLLN